MGTYVETSPVISYIPTSGTPQSVTFPWPAESLVMRRVGSRDLSDATPGGVIVRDEQTAYDLLQIDSGEFSLDADTIPFVDKFEALWSHLLRGGKCQVQIAPSAGIVLGELDSNLASGGTALSLNPTTYSGSVLADSHTPYRLQRIGGPQFETLTFSGTGVGFGDFVIGGVGGSIALFDYFPGDVLMSATAHPEVFIDMVSVQNFQPHQRKRGPARQIQLSLRSTMPEGLGV